MAITPEEFKTLQPGDLIRIEENINGYSRSENRGPYWTRFLGDILTVRVLLDHSRKCRCVESTDGGGRDIIWNAQCIAEIISKQKIVPADDESIKLLLNRRRWHNVNFKRRV